MVTKEQAAAVASNIMLHLERMGDAPAAERNELIGSIIFETLANASEQPGRLVERLKALGEMLDKPRKELSPIQLSAAVVELMAMVDKGEHVPPEAFAHVPDEIRQAGMLLMLGVIMQTLAA